MHVDPRELYPLPLDGGEVFLVRHGESTANAMGLWQGRAEYPLTDLGLQQARHTGAFLAAQGAFDGLVSSPQGRALQTATAIGEALGLTPGLDADLAEIDVGALSGLSMDQLAAVHPEALAAFHAAEARQPHPRNRELLPGWEAVPLVVERVWRAVFRAVQPGGRVVVVAHGGVINAFLTHLLTGDAREVSWRHPSNNCAISRIALEPAGPRAVCLTDNSHLLELQP
jgi:probable phosphoglycerate mutase